MYTFTTWLWLLLLFHHMTVNFDLWPWPSNMTYIASRSTSIPNISVKYYFVHKLLSGYNRNTQTHIQSNRFTWTTEIYTSMHQGLQSSLIMRIQRSFNVSLQITKSTGSLRHDTSLTSVNSRYNHNSTNITDFQSKQHDINVNKQRQN